MKSTSTYLFTSDRLGFRNWSMDDLEEFANINADAEVMEYFPNPLTHQETEDFILRLIDHFDAHGYNYFAVEELATSEMIGFIGLAYQDYRAPFTPATDLGYRLKRSSWGRGFATEGAKRCIQYAFEDLSMERLVAVCVKKNQRSEEVMKKIGMHYVGAFDHPKLFAYPEYQRCIWYEIRKEQDQWKNRE